MKMENIKNMVVRIQSVEISNLLNVEYGAFRFACNYKKDIFEPGSDILGIYGQNGSGKTTFIRALSILQAMLSGSRLPNDAQNFITNEYNQSHMAFEFSLTDSIQFYKVFYEFTISRRNKDEESDELENEDIYPIIIKDETVKYSQLINGSWTITKALISYDINDDKVFKPDVRLKEFVGTEFIDLLVSKKLAQTRSTSFIFSERTQKLFADKLKTQENKIYYEILYTLFTFGRLDLYIIGNKDSGLISTNQRLPFNFKISKTDEGSTTLTMGKIGIKLNETTLLSEEVLNIAQQVLDTINTVLIQIIPGLHVELVNLGNQGMSDGEKGFNVEIFSIRNSRKIPMRYESEGIKKIVSILHMLIIMYNNPSMTLAIDELDAGIYEYLLGEILKIIKESGKGQLIFTSHNLRPLETLDKRSIIFTTTNPKNRYIRLAKVHANNNLRDVYYHDLLLGGQKESIYESTNPYAIDYAFRMAGEIHE
jgi:AAA15 family ATPase/GTPase